MFLDKFERYRGGLSIGYNIIIQVVKYRHTWINKCLSKSNKYIIFRYLKRSSLTVVPYI